MTFKIKKNYVHQREELCLNIILIYLLLLQG